MQNLIFIAVSSVVLALPVFGQGSTAPAGAQLPSATGVTEKVQAYEVVSIKPDKSGSGGSGMRFLPDGFEWKNVNLYLLVQGAYGIIMDSQVSGFPDWTRSEAYDIVAKVDSETAERWKKLTPKERTAEEQPMMRSILADRCEFKAHQETKELPVYNLVIAQKGLKLRESQASERSFEDMSHGGEMIVQAMPVDTVVYAFTGTVGRMIVDKTGLGDKKFDFELRWTDEQQCVADVPDAPPTLFTALEEQLGLKLVPAMGRVQLLIIDHMVRPSPN